MQRFHLPATPTRHTRATAPGRSSLGPLLGWAAALLVVGIIIAGLAALSRSGKSGSEGSTVAPVTEADWQRGKAGAAVTLIEYSDFQCPACKAYAPVTDALYDTYSDRVLFVFRHFPLRTLHPYADLAARAAEAAGKQGEFWALHDLLYENQSDWSALGTEDAVRAAFAGYAGELKLDVQQWRRDMDSDAAKEKIASDIASGTAAGVDGTPGCFLAGTRIENPRSVDAFKQLMDDALRRAPVTSSTTQEVHEHADFRIVVNGAAVDLSGGRYMSTKEKALSPLVHLHNGNGAMIHTHAAGVTLGTFLASLGITLTNDCVTIPGSSLAPANGELCNGSGNALVLMVNGGTVDDKPNYIIKDLDRILLYFGAEDQKAVDAYAKAAPDEACIYSRTCPERGVPPDEECAGGLGADCDD